MKRFSMWEMGFAFSSCFVGITEVFDLSTLCFTSVTGYVWPYALSPIMLLCIPVLMTFFGHLLMTVDRAKFGAAFILLGMSLYCVEIGYGALYSHQHFQLVGAIVPEAVSELDMYGPRAMMHAIGASFGVYVSIGAMIGKFFMFVAFMLPGAVMASLGRSQPTQAPRTKEDDVRETAFLQWLHNTKEAAAAAASHTGELPSLLG